MANGSVEVGRTLDLQLRALRITEEWWKTPQARQRHADPRDGVYLITPAIADYLMTHRQKNRPIGPGHPAKLGNAMKAGDWVLNGSTLVFNDKGELMDGQNRVDACRKSGVAFLSYCVFGSWPRNAFDTMDVDAKPRNLGHVLALHGVGLYALTAAVSRLSWLYEDMVKSNRGHLWGDVPNTKAMKEYTLRRKDEIDAAIELVAPNSRYLKGVLAPSVLTFVVMYALKQDRARAAMFATKVATGADVTLHSPIWRLLKRLEPSAVRDGEMSTEFQAAITIKAWRAVRSNESPKFLKWSKDENFPRF